MLPSPHSAAEDSDDVGDVHHGGGASVWHFVIGVGNERGQGPARGAVLYNCLGNEKGTLKINISALFETHGSLKVTKQINTIDNRLGSRRKKHIWAQGITSQGHVAQYPCLFINKE